MSVFRRCSVDVSTWGIECRTVWLVGVKGGQAADSEEKWRGSTGLRCSSVGVSLLHCWCKHMEHRAQNGVAGGGDGRARGGF